MSQSAAWKRKYGSLARVQWIAEQGCFICSRSPCENAHTGKGGMGYKSGYESILPACPGHHAEMHAGIKTFLARHGLTADDLAALAERTEARWREFEGAS